LGIYKYTGSSLVNNRYNLPCGLRCMLEDYLLQIEKCFSENTNRMTVNGDWNQLLNRISPYGGDRNEVGPLIKSKWGQTKSNDALDPAAYNEFAPDSNCVDGEHSPAGCVAVAMAQVMKHWNYPFFSTRDRKVFNWCNMPNKLITTSDCYEENKKAINTLMQDCGRTTNMTYTCGGSYTTLNNAKLALMDNYYYSSITDISCTNTTLMNHLLDIIYDELNNGRPIIMRSTDHDSGNGHAFICDGYKNRKLYINWGWNGNYDGLFVYGDLCPNIYHFNWGYGALYNIFPDIMIANHIDTLYLSNYYSPIYNYSQQIPLHRFTPNTADILVSAESRSPVVFRTIPADTSATYQAHEEVILRDGFSAERGCDFTAKIEPCVRCEDRGNDDNADDESDIYTGAQDDSEEVPAYAVGHPTTADGLYPNPTDGQVTVVTDGEVEAIVIYTADGRPVGGWKMLSLSDDHATLDVSILPDGLYLLTVRTANATTTHKLTVRK